MDYMKAKKVQFIFSFIDSFFYFIKKNPSFSFVWIKSGWKASLLCRLTLRTIIQCSNIWTTSCSSQRSVLPWLSVRKTLLGQVRRWLSGDQDSNAGSDMSVHRSPESVQMLWVTGVIFSVFKCSKLICPFFDLQKCWTTGTRRGVNWQTKNYSIFPCLALCLRE